MKLKCKRVVSLLLAGVICLLCGCTTDGKKTDDSQLETFTPIDAELLEYTEDYTQVDRRFSIPADWQEFSVQAPIMLSCGVMSVTVDMSSGISILSMKDTTKDREYLTNPTGLFSYYVRTNLAVGGYEASAQFDSVNGVRVEKAYKSPDGTSYGIEARAAGLPINFTMILSEGDGFFDMKMQAETSFGADILLNINCPNITEVSASDGAGEWMACVPQEIGWTGPYDAESTYGAADIGTSGLLGVPCAINAMDLAVVYDKNGSGGVYFADIEGDISQRLPRMQMTIINKTISGYFAAQAAPRETIVLPAVRFGMFAEGDWRKAVDSVMQAYPDCLALAQDIPAWIRECGAVYATRGIGSGACYMVTDFGDSSANYLTDYSQMPKLLEQARSFGTDVIMLCDYQLPAKATPKWKDLTAGVDLANFDPGRYLTPQENKGDYPYIREDWGGSEAFRKGVAAVHEQGGKVIVYVESFIVYQLSMLSEKVRSYAAILPTGALDGTYDDFYSMNAADERWQTLLTELAITMVREYDVDGIFFDSYGCHFNQLFAPADTQDFPPIQEYNARMLVMMNRIRTAIRRIKPDAVVLAETGSGECLHVTDGGWSADFAWFNKNTAGVILESPLKYAQPLSNIYSNGSNMNELHQVFAAGYGLCVCDYTQWLLNKDEIHALTNIRKEYADALVYAKEVRMPAVSEAGIGSTLFFGDTNCILTAVNATADDMTATVCVGSEFAGASFTELLSGTTVTADASGVLQLPIEAEGLLVLQIDRTALD